MEPETAGDPTSDQKWVRSSLRTLSQRLKEAGHTVSPPTVGRVLKTLDYALHVNAKKIEASKRVVPRILAAMAQIDSFSLYSIT